MNRVEELDYYGKKIIYFNLSNIRSNEEFMPVIDEAKKAMAKYEHKSVYTITNITDIAFDTKTKELAAEWMAFNKPYVIYGIIIGAEGIKRIMMNAVFKISGRKDAKIFSSKEQALEWIEQQ